MIQEIISYESGNMSQDKSIKFFAELVKTGFINAMQGHYQRTAHDLIEQGIISEDGEVNYRTPTTDESQLDGLNRDL